MSEIVPFDFHGSQVRVVMIDGEPWWVVNDVCAVLEIANPRNVVDRIDDDCVRQADTADAQGRERPTNVVNESGLYELIFRSDKPAARDFRRWVTREVLPQIRRTGAYGIEQMTPAEYLVYQAQRFLEQERQVARIGHEVAQVGRDVAQVSARVDGIEQRTGWFTALGYARREHLPTNHSYLNRLGRVAARIARADGVEPEKVVNEAFGEVNSYPESALAEAARDLA